MREMHIQPSTTRVRQSNVKRADADGNRWQLVGLALAGTDGVCSAGTGGCDGGEITAGQSIWTRVDDLGKVAHHECIVPLKEPLCPECSLPEAVHCPTCGWCPRESDGGCECTPVMASAEG